MTPAPRRLLLLRHAKSSWDDPSLDDAERPLAPRGRRDTRRLRRHLDSSAVEIDLVLCSPARRARDTWARVGAGLDPPPALRYVDDIYDAAARDLLRVIRETDDAVVTLLLVGHNPGMSNLATQLADEPVEFPTGGLATLTVWSVWGQLAWGGAELATLVRPRELPDE